MLKFRRRLYLVENQNRFLVILISYGWILVVTENMYSPIFYKFESKRFSDLKKQKMEKYKK